MELLQKAKDQENELEGLFEDVMNKLAVDYSLVETDYKHQFAEDKVALGQTTSPYMVVKDEND